MKSARISAFWIYLIMVVAQMVICNYFYLGYYITLSLLPALILLMPIGVGTLEAMAAAFVTGFAVDALAEGLIGLNMLALVPVAYLRRHILSLVFGREIYAREENVSIRKHGLGKVIVALLMAQALFLAIYIWADTAGTTPLWFDLARFAGSLIVSLPLSLLAEDILEDR